MASSFRKCAQARKDASFVRLFRYRMLRPRLTSLAAPVRFRVSGWDPVLITSQIIALQGLYYLTLAALLPLALSVSTSRAVLEELGGSESVDYLFASAPAPLWWTISLVQLLTAFATAFYLYHLVRRPTHILDFATTLALNHFILCTYFTTSWPTAWWWISNTISCLVMTLLAERMCVRREMREGFVSTVPSTPRNGSSTPRNGSITPRNGFTNTGAGKRNDNVITGNGDGSNGDEMEMGKMSSGLAKVVGHARAASAAGSRQGGSEYERVSGEDRN